MQSVVSFQQKNSDPILDENYANEHRRKEYPQINYIERITT